MKDYKVACILPVHNEEKTIKNVIDKLLSYNLFNEIIAITDGTTDKSLSILKKFAAEDKIIWLNYKKNRGKGFALARGITKSTSDIIVFFDTDQYGIEKKHLEKMINPLKKNKANCVIGYLCFGPLSKELDLAVFKKVCGNRSYYKKDLLPYLPQMEKKRRGIELFLNYELRKKHKKILLVPLWGLKQYHKHFKRTPDEALLDYLREGYELAIEYARQKKVSASKQTEFIADQMLKFLKGYARTLHLTTKKLETIVDDFLEEL